MGDIIQSLKEFIWDIIGYLIPGFVLLIVFNFFIPTSIGIENSFLFEWVTFGNYLIIVLSYCLGFVVYSFTIFKIRNQDYVISKIENKLHNWIQKEMKRKKRFERYIVSKHSKYWQRKFKKSSTFTSAKEFLKKQNVVGIETMKLNEMRNILMSRNPEMDDKVYTFMFRSSVFDHLATILMIVCFTGFLQVVLIILGSDLVFIKTSKTYVFLYFIFIILIPLLGNCKRMFYSISQRIPFSSLK